MYLSSVWIHSTNQISSTMNSVTLWDASVILALFVRPCWHVAVNFPSLKSYFEACGYCMSHFQDFGETVI